jgi:hypothetical protein
MGMIIGTWGVTNAFVQIVFLKWIVKMLGPRNAIIVGQSSYIVIFGLYPLLKHFIQRSGGMDARVWTVLVIQLMFHMLGAMAFGMYYFPCYPAHYSHPKYFSIHSDLYCEECAKPSFVGRYKWLGAVYSIRDEMYRPLNRFLSVLAITGKAITWRKCGLLYFAHNSAHRRTRFILASETRVIMFFYSERSQF